MDGLTCIQKTIYIDIKLHSVMFLFSIACIIFNCQDVCPCVCACQPTTWGGGAPMNQNVCVYVCVGVCLCMPLHYVGDVSVSQGVCPCVRARHPAMQGRLYVSRCLCVCVCMCMSSYYVGVRLYESRCLCVSETYWRFIKKYWSLKSNNGSPQATRRV